MFICRLALIVYSLKFIQLWIALVIYIQCNNTDEEGAIAETSTGQDPEEPPYKRFKYLSTVLSERLKEQGKSLTQTTQQSPEQKELEKYSNEPVAKENQDPLYFWVCNQSKYPHRAPVAFDLLVIPASSAPVERMFSTVGIITSGRRNRLGDKHLEREVLIKRNKIYL